MNDALTPVIEGLLGDFCGGLSLPEETHLSISMLKEEAMRGLNRRFLGEDAPTDVLAFPLHSGAGGFIIPDHVPLLLLGDIVVCPPRVHANAAEAGHSFLRELSLVVVHGLLHLFGMDHDTEDNKRVMWETQERYWDTIEQALSYPISREAGN
ncbi:MAG: rRNA maturation RNase YbeY [Thermovirgaceae bacterium]|nr:rRNA maturation RNase YbeY [Thermovirgaceae bacterium]